MKKKSVSVFVFTIILLFQLIFHTTFASNNTEKSKEDKEDSYLIGFKQEEDIPRFLDHKKLKEKKHQKLKHQKTVAIKLTKTEVEEIMGDPNITFIEEDAEVNLSTSDSSIQSIPWGIQDIGAIEAQKNGAIGTSIKIAVLDTGISNHPDLAVKGGASFVEGSAEFMDDNGHGTHVAGTIAALNNEMGVIGVAPKAEIYSLKVLDQNGSGNYSNVIQAIEWAIDNQINIISMSFGGNVSSEALHEAIQYANGQGILLIAAAGNAGSGIETEAYPALYPEVISVGAIDSTNTRAAFSSTGNELDLMAPGVNILSTTMDGNYGFLSGTSMAAPHVTGAAASYWSVNPTLSNEQVKQNLLETATDLGENHEYGEGKINLLAALGLETQQPLPEENNNNVPPSSFSVLRQYEDRMAHLANSFLYLKNKALEAGNEGLAKLIEEDYNILIIENRNLFKPLDETFTDNPEGLNLSSNDYFEANVESFSKLEGYFNQKLLSFMNELGVNSEALKDISANLGTNLILDQPIDIQLGTGLSEVYTFTPSVTGSYKIYTGPYASTGTTNDTVVEVYSDAGLNTLVASNDNANNTLFSEIKTDLTANVTYHIKIQPKTTSDSVYARLTVSNNYPPVPLALNTPLDVDIVSGDSKIFSFNTSVNGSFKFTTTYYGGTSSSGSSDTVLYVYTDNVLTKQIAYNDDSNGSLFSEISLNLASGSTVYIKLRGYSSRSVHARINVSKNIQTFTQIQKNTPIDVNVGEKQFAAYSFTPSDSGIYQLFTGPIYGTGSSNDTYLYLYEDANLTKLLSSNDDWGGTLFSRIRYKLTAGKTYYVVLNGYARQAISTRLTVSAGNQYFYDSHGKLDYVLLSNGRILDYQYDANGNLVKKVLQP
jgi:hypothetical protein